MKMKDVISSDKVLVLFCIPYSKYRNPAYVKEVSEF
jgi:hypothetical protein